MKNVFKNLTSIEENQYLQLKEEGSKEAEYKLIEHNLGLVTDVVKNLKKQFEQNEDLISIGVFGLIKGINTFDRKHKTKLSTYATKCIKNEIFMYLKKNKLPYTEVSLEAPIYTYDDGNSLSLNDILASNNCDVEQSIMQREDFSNLVDILNLLPEQERKLVVFRYFMDMTQVEVAKLMDIAQPTVSTIESKTLVKIKELLNLSKINSDIVNCEQEQEQVANNVKIKSL